MNLIISATTKAAYFEAAQIILRQICQNPKSRLGLATGGTAQSIYPYLVAEYIAGRANFSQITTINLDEYVGLSKSHEQSYSYFMDTHLFNHVNIKKSNTFVPDGAQPVDAELARFQQAIINGGAPDLQLLGMGVSGHIGFNEPSDKLISGVHIEKLLPSTISANSRFFSSDESVPQMAITMGVGDILSAKEIVIVACGIEKALPAAALLIDDKVTTHFPVTFLKLHPHVTVIIDTLLADKIGL